MKVCLGIENQEDLVEEVDLIPETEIGEEGAMAQEVIVKEGGVMIQKIEAREEEAIIIIGVVTLLEVEVMREQMKAEGIIIKREVAMIQDSLKAGARKEGNKTLIENLQNILIVLNY